MVLRSIPGCISLLALAGTGCFESIAPDRTDAGAPGDAEPFGRYTTVRVADGTFTTRVDATSATDWTHGDFETGTELAADGPWDLRFQRFHISTNGGVSGSGGVEVAPVPGVPFAQVTAPPAAGWISDIPDGDDAGTEPDYAFDLGDGWYDYDPMTHVLKPKPLVWVVKTNGGSLIKLEILRYYDTAGTAGRFTLHWGPL